MVLKPSNWDLDGNTSHNDERETKRQLDNEEQGTERMKQKWHTVESSTTRLLNQIDKELMKDDHPDVGLIQVMLAILSAKENSLGELDQDMEELTSMEEVEADIELAEEYRDCIMGMKSQALQILSKQETLSNNNPLPVCLSGAIASSVGSYHSNQWRYYFVAGILEPV